MRKFIIYDKSHVADPGLLNPVIDITDSDNPIFYTDVRELKNLIDELHEHIIAQDAFLKGNWEARKDIGISSDDYIIKQKERRKREGKL
jgi:hypothetical protein